MLSYQLLDGCCGFVVVKTELRVSSILGNTVPQSYLPSPPLLSLNFCNFMLESCAFKEIRWLVLPHKFPVPMQAVHGNIFSSHYKYVLKGNKSPNGISDYPKIRVTVTRDQPRRVLPSFG